MVRLIVLAVVGYIFYRAIKTWMIGAGSPSGDGNEASRNEVDDVLVQDPVCKTYIAQRNSLHVRRNGQLVHFCSTQCRDRFIEEHPEH